MALGKDRLSEQLGFDLQQIDRNNKELRHPEGFSSSVESRNFALKYLKKAILKLLRPIFSLYFSRQVNINHLSLGFNATVLNLQSDLRTLQKRVDDLERTLAGR